MAKAEWKAKAPEMKTSSAVKEIFSIIVFRLRAVYLNRKFPFHERNKGREWVRMMRRWSEMEKEIKEERKINKS